MGIGAPAVSPGECFDARSLRDIALAGFAEFARAGRMAWCGALGPAPGGGGIGGLDHRDEEHRIGFVLPAIDSFLCQVAKSKRPRRNESEAIGTTR